MAWIKIEGQKLSLQQLEKFIPTTPNSIVIIDFINSWNSGQQNFEFETSGSTGKPKKIIIARAQMEQSAKMTIDFLKLKQHSTALLCMNPTFIGGKMMIVRSLLNNMNLVVSEPTSTPLIGIAEPIDFAALVPLQLSKSLTPKMSLEKVKTISNIIVGGGQINAELKKELKTFTNSIYSTYGMTETVSHIGLQLLSKQSDEDYYTVLDNVEIGTDRRGCLTIQAPVTNNIKICTNDRVELLDNCKFKWLGRIDNVINSGGIKIQIELVENILAKIFNLLNIENRFIFKGIKDEVLGQKVILIIEGGMEQDTFRQLQIEIVSKLHKYEKPKEIQFVNNFQETPTGKIIRGIEYESVSKEVI